MNPWISCRVKTTWTTRKTKGGGEGQFSWMNEKTKYTHFLCGCKEKPLCFRWVSASVLSRAASTPSHPSSPACHPDTVRHCGKIRYKSPGPSGDTRPQIRPAHSCHKNQGWPLEGNQCVCEGVITHHKAIKGWWVCLTLIHLYTNTDSKSHRWSETWCIANTILSLTLFKMFDWLQ